MAALLQKQFVLPERAKKGERVMRAEGVSVQKDGRHLLQDISLELRAGEILTLLGPNGAGKSTLLSVLSADEKDFTGQVEFAGRRLHDWSLLDLSRRRGVLLQDNQVMFPFTVHQVVEMGRSPWRRTPLEQDDNEAISDAIAAADISHLGNRRVPSLSGGERARASFARVIAGRTSILMLDEPTAALDLGHQEKVLGLAKQRAEAGDAVLIVLHDLNLAFAYADRVAVLKKGKLEALGTPEDVLTGDILTSVYGTPVEVIKHPVTGHGIVTPKRY